MILEKELLHIGEITRTHGNHGELQCRMVNDCWETTDAQFVVLKIDAIFVPFRVTDWRCKGAEDVLLTLRDIDTETKAAHLVGTSAFMLKKDLTQEQQELLTWPDLIGYSIHDDTQGNIGKVKAIDDTTINTLLILEDGRLIPAHEDFIINIDAEHRILHVSLPEGL